MMEKVLNSAFFANSRRLSRDFWYFGRKKVPPRDGLLICKGEIRWGIM